MTNNTERSVAEVGLIEEIASLISDRMEEKYPVTVSAAWATGLACAVDELVSRHRTEAEARVGEVEPVAWRWRYVRPSGPKHWVVRQSPREPQEATEHWCAVEVQPLYAAAALKPTEPSEE